MVVVEYSYDAWGNVLSTSGSMASTLGVANPIRYRSYYYDTETGWYYLQSRYYNPEWGRFISSDELSVIEASPMALTDKNLYAYCDNDPVTRVDADGEFWLISVGSGLGSAIVRSVVTEGIKSIEDTIKGTDDSAVESLINIGLGTVIDWGFGKTLDKINSFMLSKMPRNYSSYAHVLRQSDPNLTKDEISSRLKHSINTNRNVFKGISIVFDIVKLALN